MKKIFLLGDKATLPLWNKLKHNYVSPEFTEIIYGKVGLRQCNATHCFLPIGLFLGQKSRPKVHGLGLSGCRKITSHWQPLFSKKMAAAASFSYKIGGGGLIFLQNWRHAQGFGNITGGCSDMVWILDWLNWIELYWMT